LPLGRRYTMTITRIILVLVVSIVSTPAGTHNLNADDSSIEYDFATAIATIFGDQPDYVADLSIVIATPIRMKMARKEGKVRLEWLNPRKSASGRKEGGEYYRTILLHRPKEPSVAFDPQQKTYCEMPDEFTPPAPEMLELLKKT